MKTQLSESQKTQIKQLKKVLAREKKYTPHGQGDSVNQHLTITNIHWEIEETKKNPGFISYRI